MGTTALVKDDINAGQHVIGLLGAAGMPLEDAFWIHQPQTGEWRLILSSPWVDQKGISTAYIALSNALHNSPLLGRLPFRRISLVSPKDPLLKSAQAANEVTTSNQNRYYTYFLHDLLDSYRYEGALHVVQSFRGGRHIYAVIFAPYKGPRGAVPALELASENAFRDFMTNRIGVPEESVRIALRELEKKHSYSFPEIHLERAELKKLGLLPK